MKSMFVILANIWCAASFIISAISATNAGAPALALGVCFAILSFFAPKEI